MRRFISIALSGICLVTAMLWGAEKNAGQNGRRPSYLVYVGTYTGPSSKGIYAYRFDAVAGKSTKLGVAAETTNPSFLVINPDRTRLYAVNEISNYENQNTGSISSFSIDRETGKLTFLNKVSSGGAGPCYLALDRTAKYLLAANYDAGTVAVFPVMPDGRLGAASATVQHQGHGADPERQASPHPHWLGLSPDNRFAVAADLGVDKVFIYRFDAAHGSLVPATPNSVSLPPGSGPRHFTFHPNGKFGYVVNEMGSTVTGFSYDAKNGALHEIQSISTLPESFKGHNDTAEIQIHPNGKFLYASNRGHDSIAVFAVNSKNGALKSIEYVSSGGKTPRTFEIDPSGSFLFAANQRSDRVDIFPIDVKSGRLTPTGEVLDVPSPVCIKFVALP
jgi:6-phosphogluconolactonase